MVTNTSLCLSLDEVAPRGLEEVQHGSLLEGGRVGDVDYSLRAVQRRGEPLASQRVHTRGGRGRYGVVAEPEQICDDLAADQPGPADDDNLHGCLSLARAGTRDRLMPVTRQRTGS